MKFFTLSEFDSPDAKGSGQNMDPVFLQQLDRARDLAGCPFVVNSGYRTKSANQKAGGVLDSAHLSGLACDIATPDSNTRHRVLYGLISAGFNRLGIGENYIHVDRDKSKAPNVAWLY